MLRSLISDNVRLHSKYQMSRSRDIGCTRGQMQAFNWLLDCKVAEGSHSWPDVQDAVMQKKHNHTQLRKQQHS